MIATALTVFPFRALAVKIEMVDYPDNIRKLHKRPVPVGGGVVIFGILIAVLCLLIFFRDQFAFNLGISPKLFLPLLITSPFIVAVGLIDDKWGVRGTNKLLCQIVGASIVVGFAKYYSTVAFFGETLNLHHMFYPIAVFWLIGVINAINLLDGADGVAVTACFYMAITATGMALINGHHGIALISLSLAGCLLGFFAHNKPSARIYLGDAGSMFIGLVLGLLILRASVETNRTISVCGPLAIVLIPMFDSCFAIIRRVNSGRTIFSPDRGHLHHLLLLKYSSPYGVLCLVSLLILPGCVAALAGCYYRNDLIPVAVSCVVLPIAIATDLFGRREFFILLHRIKCRFRKSFHKKKYLLGNGEIYHIQGNGPWRKVWNNLVPALAEKSCHRLQLDISMPDKGEDFFAEWVDIETPGSDRFAAHATSLIVQGRRVGTLKITFNIEGRDRHDFSCYTTKICRLCEACINQYYAGGAIEELLSAFRLEGESELESISLPNRAA